MTTDKWQWLAIAGLSFAVSFHLFEHLWRDRRKP
jgi:hypothetical protein